MTIIAMWSGPRNLSTAMMRSFGARADCAVMDEPFFAPFLKVTGKAHPGRKETLAAHECDPVKAAGLCAAPTDAPYHFKNICRIICSAVFRWIGPKAPNIFSLSESLRGLLPLMLKGERSLMWMT